MARNCFVCTDRRRVKIDHALVDGSSGLRLIAKRFGIAYMNLYRHRKNHLTQRVLKSQEAKDAIAGGDLFARLHRCVGETHEILKKAKKAGDWNTALRAVARLERQIELEAELQGDLARRANVNVTVCSTEIAEALHAYIDTMRASAQQRQPVVEVLPPGTPLPQTARMIITAHLNPSGSFPTRDIHSTR